MPSAGGPSSLVVHEEASSSNCFPTDYPGLPATEGSPFYAFSGGPQESTHLVRSWNFSKMIFFSEILWTTSQGFMDYQWFTEKGLGASALKAQ